MLLQIGHNPPALLHSLDQVVVKSELDEVVK